MNADDYRQPINHVIKAISRAPGEAWTTQRLAGLAGISAFHFHRLFRALTGETMFAFLQRRRLLRAIELIHEDKFSLTDIALECGFDSGSSLSRTFRKQLGCTPSEYRQRHPALLLPPVHLRALPKLDLPVEIRETTTRHAVIVERKGMIEHSFARAAAAAFSVLIRELQRVNGWPQVRRVTIPAGKWGVCLHRGLYESLWQPWNRMYRNWLPTAGHHLRAAPPFEVYLNRPKQTPPDELRTEIWIPIE